LIQNNDKGELNTDDKLLETLFNQLVIHKENEFAVRQFDVTKAMIILVNKWLKIRVPEYQIEEVKFNMIKFKVKRGDSLPISALFELTELLQDTFKFIYSVSINSVSLEEIFWKMNQDYKDSN